jgi:hypothetical protein
MENKLNFRYLKIDEIYCFGLTGSVTRKQTLIGADFLLFDFRPESNFQVQIIFSLRRRHHISLLTKFVGVSNESPLASRSYRNHICLLMLCSAE